MNYVEDNQGVHVDQTLKNILIPRGNTAYRLTLFLWNPTADIGASTITFTMQWTAPFGGVQTMNVTLNLASPPSAQTMDATIWAAAGTPIQYSVLGGGTYGAATYSYLLGLNDLTTVHESSHDDSCCSPLTPVSLPRSCCQRCGAWPCRCNQQVMPQQGCGTPNVIVVPAGGGYPPQPYPPPYYRGPRRMRYADDDDDDWDDVRGTGPFNGPFIDLSCCP